MNDPYMPPMDPNQESNPEEEKFALSVMLRLLDGSDEGLSPEVKRKTARALLRRAGNDVDKALQMWQDVKNDAAG